MSHAHPTPTRTSSAPSRPPSGSCQPGSEHRHGTNPEPDPVQSPDPSQTSRFSDLQTDVFGGSTSAVGLQEPAREGGIYTFPAQCAPPCPCVARCIMRSKDYVA